MAGPGRTVNERRAAKARARAAWTDLADRLATVTPAALGRAALAAVVIAGSLAIVRGTWPALVPFFAGGLIAYVALPIVDSLDRVMPRPAAAILAIVGIVTAVVAVFVIVVPPLAIAAVDLSANVPDATEIDRQVDAVVGQLPETAREVVGPILVAAAVALKDALASASGGLDDVAPLIVQAAVGVAAAAFGLIVLPTWLVMVLSNKRAAGTAVDRRLAHWIRPDFWAVVHMLDRALGTYLRGFVVVAFLTGSLLFLGLTASSRLGGPAFPGALALSVFVGALQLVPEFGWFLGLIPVAALLLIDPERAVAYLAVYIVARWLSGAIIGRRVESRLTVHPLVLIPGIVALSQLGLVWLLLSGPILSFASDLIRYTHGRLSDPPKPAGILPGVPLPAPSPDYAPAAVPAVYRRFRRAPATTPTVTRPASPTR